jgi:hypothetical protein
VLRLTAVVVATGLSWVGWNQATYNFGITQPGRLYRSGQMPAAALRRTILEQKIRTVLNLRGPNLAEAWYRQEIAATLDCGAVQVDIPLSSCVWMSRAQLRALVQALDCSEYPVLVHCAWGSERTGLASAIAALLRPGGTIADARAQLSVRYLYLRLGDGRIMAEFLDRYEEWLAERGLRHSPATFRTWAAEGYVPGKPSREQWPYDPFPLTLVTRPAPRSTRLAGPKTGKLPHSATIRR